MKTKKERKPQSPDSRWTLTEDGYDTLTKAHCNLYEMSLKLTALGELFISMKHDSDPLKTHSLVGVGYLLLDLSKKISKYSEDVYGATTLTEEGSVEVDHRWGHGKPTEKETPEDQEKGKALERAGLPSDDGWSRMQIDLELIKAKKAGLTISLDDAAKATMATLERLTEEKKQQRKSEREKHAKK